jgi:hypothetical protein
MRRLFGLADASPELIALANHIVALSARLLELALSFIRLMRAHDRCSRPAASSFAPG